ncbi:unnamed protein product [Hydatigera taeniaeformis]|uniref:Membrane-associated protein n=1 Tax=Hydatigena taeniaeformis TaxID=6205 RepID=A0A0R3XAC2_HYDTA|nr:unnamed protein product [Hydatigera taeniaeformis]
MDSVKSASEGFRSSLAINICFNPTAPILRAALPALMFTILSFILLWALPCGPQLISIAQGILNLLYLATWTHYAGVFPTRFTLVDAWFILCLGFIGVAFFITLYEHRRLDRLCAGGFCGAGGGFIGLGNGQANPMGSGGSPPSMGLMHQPSPVTMPTKFDICNEAYFRSASSELSKDSSAVMSLGTALRLRCAKNGGLSVFEPNDSNLGPIKSQYASSSTPGDTTALNGCFLQPLGPIPPSYCTTVIAVALPILYILAVIVFWGFFGVQGTVPKACLGLRRMLKSSSLWVKVRISTNSKFTRSLEASHPDYAWQIVVTTRSEAWISVRRSTICIQHDDHFRKQRDINEESLLVRFCPGGILKPVERTQTEQHVRPLRKLEVEKIMVGS